MESQLPEVPSSSVSTEVPARVKSDSSALVDIKPAFHPPSQIPTQAGPLGIRFDFNDGCRVLLPKAEKTWRVRLSDLDTGNILFEVNLEEGWINSSKRYFVRIRVEVWHGEELQLLHDYDARDQEVLIQLPDGTLGDSLGWLPYVEKFRERHHCKMACAVAARLIPLFKETYPEIELVPMADIKPDRYYASYLIGLFFDDEERVHQPCDFRLVGLHRTAAYILGVDPAETPPRIHIEDDARPISEPYVCVAVQSSTQCKYWNNSAGWMAVVKYLKDAGYRVICIDQKPVHGSGLVWTQIPYGAEDETGDRPLAERVRWLKHAAFMVGLSSGLAWLAWGVGTPVVMISGFTHETNEFHTPYRVINYHACNSCWNDPRVRFDHKDFLWCPRHRDTPRHYECTRLITADQVISKIRLVCELIS